MNRGMQYMDIRIRRIVKRCEDLRAQDCVLVRRRLGKRNCRTVGVIVVFDATNDLPIGILDGITGLEPERQGRSGKVSGTAES